MPPEAGSISPITGGTARTATPRRPRQNDPMAGVSCPCGSGALYADCCEPLHDGAVASTAEKLMRSRFSAFALGRASYLLASWHPLTRPARLDLDADVTWRRLQVVDVVAGGTGDADGVDRKSVV